MWWFAGFEKLNEILSFLSEEWKFLLLYLGFITYSRGSWSLPMAFFHLNSFPSCIGSSRSPKRGFMALIRRKKIKKNENKSEIGGRGGGVKQILKVQNFILPWEKSHWFEVSESCQCLDQHLSHKQRATEHHLHIQQGSECRRAL